MGRGREGKGPWIKGRPPTTFLTNLTLCVGDLL